MEASEDSLLVEAKGTSLHTPVKPRRNSLPFSSSNGIPHVTPHYSSIMVSPPKPPTTTTTTATATTTTTATTGNMTSPTHPIASPTKTLHHLPNDLVSPSKKKTENDMVSEDTIQRVKAAIERDPTLKKSNLQDEKPAPLEKFVIVVSNT